MSGEEMRESVKERKGYSAVGIRRKLGYWIGNDCVLSLLICKRAAGEGRLTVGQCNVI